MGAELIPETTQVAAGASLAFTLINHGPGSISFGQFYAVQVEKDEDWIDTHVQPRGTGFTLAGHGMSAGRTYEQSVTVCIDVPPGRYRVVKCAQAC